MWSFHGSEDLHQSRPACDTVQSGKLFPMFRKNLLSLFSEDTKAIIKMDIETLVTKYQTKQYYNPEDYSTNPVMKFLCSA
jgi:hypothetical protein